MLTENEKASNNLYLIWNEKKNIKEIVTYRSNVIKEIQRYTDSNKNLEINRFPSKSVTDEKFERFVQNAKDAGYTIYKVVKL